MKTLILIFTLCFMPGLLFAKPERASRLLALKVNSSFSTEVERTIRGKQFEIPIRIVDYPVVLDCSYRLNSDLIVRLAIDRIDENRPALWVDPVEGFLPGRSLMVFSLSIPELTLSGDFSLTSASRSQKCAQPLELKNVTVPIRNVVITLLIEPEIRDGRFQLTFFNDMFEKIPTLSAEKIRFPGNPGLEERLNQIFEAMKRPFFRFAGEVIQAVLSNRVNDYFGQFVWQYRQPLKNIVSSNMFIRPIVYEKGPFEVRSNNQNVNIDNYFYRRSLRMPKPFSILDGAVSFFFNARVEHKSDSIDMPEPVQPATEALFDKQNTHFAVAISSSLINDILSTIYRDGLLNLKAYIKVGMFFRDFVNEQLPESVKTSLLIDPQKPPNIAYNARNVSIGVDNVTIKVGTELEDRTIPSFTVSANALIESRLSLNPENNSVSLMIKKDGVRVRFAPVDHTMTQDQLRLFESLFADIFTDYFEKNPSLALFPPVLDLKRLKLSIRQIDVKDEYVLMYLNVDLDKSDFFPANKDNVITLQPIWITENGRHYGESEEKRNK